MDTQSKLDILSRDAQYDLSCACGTKNPQEHRKRNTAGSGWLYPTTTVSGGPGIMLKTLMGNRCANDCKYCPLRNDQDFRPVALAPKEMASFFHEFQSKRPLIGLFLSSAVLGCAEKTMEMLTDTARILRNSYRYRGYIHLKVIPGSSKESIDEALKYASALSLNIEAPGEQHFSKLSESKNYVQDILQPLTYIASQTAKGARYERVHTSSQFIVGASDELDKEILLYTSRLYQELHMGRLYFSAYQKGLGDQSLPGEQKQHQHSQLELFDLGQVHETDHASLTREHRLYQADWLLRKYGFSYEEMIFTEERNLSLTKDPKLVWAQANPQYFPLSVKRSPKEALLRVPGLGPTYVGRIVSHRRMAPLSCLEDLKLPFSVLEKARPFLTI
ncbi:MAG: radical SAM protein [Sphaerochaeta associata]|uniref:radical SAM protein n=1 Tax=Sphaerochaeta associata TaxID=1129264 RepID=UPI002B1F7E86|nr:radical SAM protein [Sphaerochaeta associata]MEA5029608.1 radical SAM protein [Sphaerochaeta associata]